MKNMCFSHDAKWMLCNNNQSSNCVIVNFVVHIVPIVVLDGLLCPFEMTMRSVNQIEMRSGMVQPSVVTNPTAKSPRQKWWKKREDSSHHVWLWGKTRQGSVCLDLWVHQMSPKNFKVGRKNLLVSRQPAFPWLGGTGSEHGLFMHVFLARLRHCQLNLFKNHMKKTLLASMNLHCLASESKHTHHQLAKQFVMKTMLNLVACFHFNCHDCICHIFECSNTWAARQTDASGNVVSHLMVKKTELSKIGFWETPVDSKLCCRFFHDNLSNMEKKRWWECVNEQVNSLAKFENDLKNPLDFEEPTLCPRCNKVQFVQID